MALRVNQENFNQEVLEAKVPVLVEFYSDSCVPCKQMSPILGDLEDEYQDKLKIVKINVNFDLQLAQDHMVMGSPTFLFFKNGEEKTRLRGITKKPELIEMINSIL